MIPCVIRGGKGGVTMYRHRDSLLSPLFAQTIWKKKKEKRERRAWGERSFSMEVRELKKKTNRNRCYWKYPTSEFETNVAGLCEDSYPIFIYGNSDATWREKKKKKERRERLQKRSGVGEKERWKKA